jgi:hypothetical protein
MWRDLAWLSLVIVLNLTCEIAITQAAPPAGVAADAETSAWYRSLVDGHGIGCCSEADCRNVEYRTSGDGYEVYIDRRLFGAAAPDAWVTVPSDSVLIKDNPTGGAVACYYHGRVLCFVKANET